MRDHTTATVGHVETHLIVLAADDVPLADVEEAIKAAARASIASVRSKRVAAA